MKKQKILVLGPHTDDGEWGAGGSISCWIERGHEVHYVAFSAAEESVLPEFPSDVLRQEIYAASARLGLAGDFVRVLNFKVRYFPRDRQEILETMIQLRREINPSLVLIPSRFDTHQDHEVIFEEGFRAFKKSSILGYEIPWNNRTIELSYFQHLGLHHVEKKVSAIGEYKSQVFRTPNFHEFVRSLAVQRGVQIGAQFAEAFEVIRWVET